MYTAFTTLFLMSFPLLLFPIFAHYLVAHTSLIPVPGKHFLFAVPRSLLAHFFISFLELKLHPFPNTSLSALFGFLPCLIFPHRTKHNLRDYSWLVLIMPCHVSSTKVGFCLLVYFVQCSMLSQQL